MRFIGFFTKFWLQNYRSYSVLLSVTGHSGSKDGVKKPVLQPNFCTEPEKTHNSVYPHPTYESGLINFHIVQGVKYVMGQQKKVNPYMCNSVFEHFTNFTKTLILH